MKYNKDDLPKDFRWKIEEICHCIEKSAKDEGLDNLEMKEDGGPNSELAARGLTLGSLTNDFPVPNIQ